MQFNQQRGNDVEVAMPVIINRMRIVVTVCLGKGQGVCY